MEQRYRSKLESTAIFIILFSMLLMTVQNSRAAFSWSDPYLSPRGSGAENKGLQHGKYLWDILLPISE